MIVILPKITYSKFDATYLPIKVLVNSMAIIIEVVGTINQFFMSNFVFVIFNVLYMFSEEVVILLSIIMIKKQSIPFAGTSAKIRLILMIESKILYFRE